MFASDNPYVPCGVGREAWAEGDMRAGRRKGVGRRPRRKQRAGKAPTVGAEGRTRAKRTENMPLVLMTLDVSRLSGWLNADALCRVEKEA